MNGNVLTESVSYNSEPAKIIAYEYDSEGRVVKTTYPSQSELDVVEYKYDSDGKVTKILQNNKTVREYSYDSFERVIAIKDYNEPGSSSYILKSYVYGQFGRCISMVYTEKCYHSIYARCSRECKCRDFTRID